MWALHWAPLLCRSMIQESYWLPKPKNIIKSISLNSFPGGSSGKGSTCQCKRCEIHPWIRKILWKKKWLPLQYSSLENPKNRGSWQATVQGVAKELDTTEQLSTANYAGRVFQAAGCCCCWIANSFQLSATPWTATCQASMSLTISQRQQVQTQIMLSCWSDTYPCSLKYTS